VFILEIAIKLLPPGKERVSLLVYFGDEGYSISKTTPLWQSKEIVKILANHYPERLSKVNQLMHQLLKFYS